MSQPTSEKKTRQMKLAKGLAMAGVFTLLGSILLGVLSTLTSGYTTVIHAEDIEMIQTEEPKSGDPKAVVHTTLGDMTFALYPSECPKAVENFCTLAESGYYNNTYVFRIEPEVFFSAGAPQADGSLNAGEEAAERERIPQELSPKLWPLRGALCALTSSVEGGIWKRVTKTEDIYTGSRFLVADTIEMTDEIRQGLENDTDEAMKPVAEAFLEYGGIPNYAQQVTVFGQLTEGFEVLDAITSAAVAENDEAHHPKDEIKILTVEITKF